MSSPNINRTNEDLNGINNLLRAAENLDKDRIKDLIEVDKTLNKIGKDVIIDYLNTNPRLTMNGLVNLSKDMRLNGMTLFKKEPRFHYVENYSDETKALSQTDEERRQAIIDARNGPRIERTPEVSENTMANSRKGKFGGKRRNKTRGKSRRRKSRSRKSRRKH